MKLNKDYQRIFVQTCKLF